VIGRRPFLTLLAAGARAQAPAPAPAPAAFAPPPRGRSLVERLAPERLAAVHAVRRQLAARRRQLAPFGIYRAYRAVQHVHAGDSNHTFGTLDQTLAAAKKTGVEIVMLTAHGGARPEAWQGLRDGVLYFSGGEANHAQTYPQPEPGLRFHCHVEEQLDAPHTGFDGMEIYNRHTDAGDDKDFEAFAKELAADPARQKAFAALVRQYPDEVYGAGGHYWPPIFERWDRILRERRFPGVSAIDVHQNLRLPDGAGGTVLVDSCETAFRNTCTHVWAREFTPEAIQQSLREGRSFVAHDWLCDPSGFSFLALNNFGAWETGDGIPLAAATRLAVRTPVPALIRVFHRGQVIDQRTTEQFTLPIKDAGPYRAEAWLEIDGELRPWIYSNPIYAETPHISMIQMPPSTLAPGVEAVKDLAYVAQPVEEAKQKLDIFRPAGAKGRPVLFYLHGGAWRNGDRSQYPSLGSRVAREGFVVVVPSYRLAPKNAWPAQIDDAAAALVWTMRHIAEYGGDPKRIVVAGHSAGGHLAALMAVDLAHLAKLGADLSGVRAIVGISGVYDVTMEGGMSPREPFGSDPETLRRASPQFQARSGAPRFFLAYCQWDYVQLPQQAARMHSTLTVRDNRSELVYLPKENHISELLNAWRDDSSVTALLLRALRDAETAK
jgi:acetyl esterase/lipase